MIRIRFSRSIKINFDYEWLVDEALRPQTNTWGDKISLRQLQVSTGAGSAQVVGQEDAGYSEEALQFLSQFIKVTFEP